MSSHREAPEISKDPVADSSDLYAFVSPDKPDTVTIIANYVPLQLPASGRFARQVRPRRACRNGRRPVDVERALAWRGPRGSPTERAERAIDRWRQLVSLRSWSPTA